MNGENIGFLLSEYAKKKKIDRATLGRITGINDKTIKSCFEGSESTKQGTIKKIKDALGIKKIVYTLVD